MKRKSRKKESDRIVYILIGVLLIIAAWFLISYFLKKNGNMVFPYPHEAFGKAFVFLFSPKEAEKNWIAIGWTILRLLIGFSISYVLGIVLGTLAACHRKIEHILKPWIVLSRTVPTAAVVLLFIGIFFTPKSRNTITFIPCALVFLVAFPLIYESVLKGLKNDSSELLEALDLECGRNAAPAVVYVRWPNAAPYIRLGAIQSFGLSVKVLIMSEILCATSNSKPSLGGLISNSQVNGEVENIIPYSLIALAMVALVDVVLNLASSRIKIDEG